MITNKKIKRVKCHCATPLPHDSKTFRVLIDADETLLLQCNKCQRTILRLTIKEDKPNAKKYDAPLETHDTPNKTQ